MKGEKKISMEVLLPLIPLYGPERNHQLYINETHVEIKSLKDIAFDLEDFGSVEVNFDIITRNENPLRQTLVLNTTFSIDFDIYGLEHFSSSDEREYITISEMLYHFKKQLRDFLLITQIARPGSIKTNVGKIMINNEKYDSEIPIFLSSQRSILASLEEVGLKEIKTIAIMDTWEWAMGIGNIFNISGNRIQRALNAYSHLFGERITQEAYDLLNTFIGIEAIYVKKGNGALINQIIRNSIGLLGEIPFLDEKLKGTYNIRSRLIHGELDITSSHYEFAIYEEINSDIYYASLFTSMFLVRTFQELSIRKIREII